MRAPRGVPGRQTHGIDMLPQPDPPPAGDSSAVLDWIDAVADRFESAWKAGPAPRLADFLDGTDGDSRPALLQELVKIDLEYRRLAGAPRDVEEYLADFPDLLDPDGLLPDELVVYARRVCERPAGGDEPGSTLTLRGTEPGEATPGLRCPQCGNTLRGVAAGAREVSCPACGGSFRLQQEAGAAPRPRDLPRTLGRFRLLEVLGRGSFGTVYKAHDAELDRTVAVKVPRAGCFATAEEEERFLREARSAAQLSHPGIVPVHEIGRDGDLPYLVCDYVAGRTLADLLAERRPGFREAAELVAQAAEALDYAHRQGVVHRDVTPRNILLDAAGRPHLTDFGLARRDGASMVVTLDGQVLGTPAYMAPEQAAGEQARVDGRSDVYSLGVILYELLTGELPFRGSVRMLLHQVLHDEPRPPRKLNDRIPRDLETVCLKALAKEPTRRYATAGDLAADLRRHLKGEPIRARPVGQAERLGRWCRRNPVVAGSVTAAALTLVAATAVGWGLALRADAESRRVRRVLYDSQMKLAHDAWRDADIPRLLYLLEGQKPRDGAEDPPGFEWYYLRRLCHSDLRTLDGHAGAVVNSVAFSPDGTRLASAANEGTIRIWDAATGQEICTLKRLPNVGSVAFSPDGRWLAARYQIHDEARRRDVAGEVQFWDAATGRERRTLRAHDAGSISSMAFSPDGKQLVTAGTVLDAAGKVVAAEVRFWDMDTGREIRALRGHTGSIDGMAYSPDGRRLATASPDQTVKLWDVIAGRELRTLARLRGAVHGVAFRPDGRQIASASEDGTVKVWDAATGQPVQTLRGHTGSIGVVVYSPDGARLASAGGDRTVRTWDAETGQELLAIRGHRGQVIHVAFSPDGRRLASASSDGTVKIWDATADQDSRALPGHGEEAWDAAFSPDGQFLAVGADDGTVKVWDTADWHSVQRLEAHTGPLSAIAYSPDGRWLASCGRDRTVKVWDAGSGRLLHTLQGHAGPVSSVAFSPDGRHLASSSRDGTVKVWDADSGGLLRTLDCHAAVVQYVAFSPDGQRLASASDDKTVTLWDKDSGRELLTLEGHAHYVYGVAFSPDGQRLATASEDATVRVWDATTGRELFVLKGHDGWVWRAVFSPDSRRLASAGRDRTVRLWDVTTGQEILTLRGHTRAIRAVTFSPDGRRLVSAAEDGTARVWDATPCGGD